MRPMNLMIGDRPMTRLEAKHRNDIRDALTVAFKLRYKAQVDKSKDIMHSFLTEMKDRR